LWATGRTGEPVPAVPRPAMHTAVLAAGRPCCRKCSQPSLLPVLAKHPAMHCRNPYRLPIVFARRIAGEGGGSPRRARRRPALASLRQGGAMRPAPCRPAPIPRGSDRRCWYLSESAAPLARPCPPCDRRRRTSTPGGGAPRRLGAQESKTSAGIDTAKCSRTVFTAAECSHMYV
jgi:hypothetical protein